MATDPTAEMLAAWKHATDSYLTTFHEISQQFESSPAGAEMSEEAGKTYLGTRAAMADLARQAYEPMVEAAGGVPLSEFRRLADQVHTLLLRLDRIDDALAEIRAALPDR